MIYHTPLISLVRQAHALLLQQSSAESLPPGAAQRSFDRMVAPALRYARELGNVYSGSVYCLLAGLVEDAGAAPGTPIGIYPMAPLHVPRAWLSMQARGYGAAVGVTPGRLVRFFRALGFPLQVVGASRMYWGEDRCPVFCDGAAALRVFDDAAGR